jgi:hypothetical protein
VLLLEYLRSYWMPGLLVLLTQGDRLQIIVRGKIEC